MSDLRDDILDTLMEFVDCEGGGLSRAADEVMKLIPGWQPIQTADKGAEKVLLCQLYDDGSSTVKIGRWDEDLGLWNIFEPFMDEHEWTHWMPLLALPSA